MVRPRRAEQCLPQEATALQRDADALKRGRGIPYATRSPLRGVPRANDFFEFTQQQTGPVRKKMQAGDFKRAISAMPYIGRLLRMPERDRCDQKLCT